jgi:hypothetical protein
MRLDGADGKALHGHGNPRIAFVEGLAFEQECVELAGVSIEDDQ